jgi:hypothetical protein
MSERAKVEERLRRKEAEILGLEEKIKAARVYIQALRDVLRLLEDDNDPNSESGDGTLKSGSAVAQARDAILAKGQPMHINSLLEAMGRDATPASRASLIGSISAYVRRNEIFTRTAPNTFGLSELGHATAASDEPEEPPTGFGSIKPGLSDEPGQNDPFYVKDTH